MASEEGKMLFMQMFKQMMSSADENSMMGGTEMSPEMMQMMGSFTVLRMVSLMGAAGVKATKEQLLALNAELNKIKKPE